MLHLTELSTSAEPLKITSSVHDINQNKPPFGSRFLTQESDVWSKNAWDHVPPPDDQDEKIAASIARQRAAPVPDDDRQKYNDKPARHWDNFYKMNASNFFRNRKWLHTEFPELVSAVDENAGHMRIAEIGCGAGNSVFPLLSSNRNPLLDLRAYDYSTHAIKLVQNNPLYLSPPQGSIQASVWDLSSSAIPEDVEPGSVDIVVLIFVLSALHPKEWSTAIRNIHTMLKPGGLAVMRDYGRHDLTQLRFKEGRLLEDNFYIRGDKTRVYFFDLDELAQLFTGSPLPSDTTILNLNGLLSSEEESSSKALEEQLEQDTATTVESETNDLDLSDAADRSIETLITTPDVTHQEQEQSTSQLINDIPHPLFTIQQLGVDRRLIVNRKRKLKMYRVWMQGKFKKV